jgi:hypothetical protein
MLRRIQGDSHKWENTFMKITRYSKGILIKLAFSVQISGEKADISNFT